MYTTIVPNIKNGPSKITLY